MIPIFALIVTGILPAPAALAATTTTIEVAPCEVLDEQPPRINSGDFPTGFGPDSWQGPATGKSNWHARYLYDGDKPTALFPTDAATMTIADLAAISYFTKRPTGTPATRDWWVQIYTRPTGSGDKTWWYHDRYINNYGAHTETEAWTQYSTASGMTFQSTGWGGPVMTLAQLIAAKGSELIGHISIQTDSGWGGFNGYVDGLEITLTNGNIGQVNLGSALTADDRYVDDTGGIDGTNSCLNAMAPCLTIQRAVNVACPGATVHVAAGTYAEQVRIAKSLNLVGAGETTTRIDAPPKASRVTENANHGLGLRTYDYLVGVFGTGAETVNISGFTLDGNNDAKSSGPGTFRSQQLTFLNSNGTIEDNTLIDWQDPAAFGAQGVATLVSGSSTPVTVNVRGNVVSGYQKTGIVALGSGAVVTTIEGNTVTGAGPIASTAQKGIQMSNGAVGSIKSSRSPTRGFDEGSEVSERPRLPNKKTGPVWGPGRVLRQGYFSKKERRFRRVMIVVLWKRVSARSRASPVTRYLARAATAHSRIRLSGVSRTMRSRGGPGSTGVYCNVPSASRMDWASQLNLRLSTPATSSRMN